AFRLTLGIVKIFIVAGLLAPASLLGLGPEGPVSPLSLLWSSILYSVVLYCDFSGHCDIAIACSRLMGINVPENFNWPFAASSRCRSNDSPRSGNSRAHRPHPPLAAAPRRGTHRRPRARLAARLAEAAAHPTGARRHLEDPVHSRLGDGAGDAAQRHRASSRT